MWKRTSLTIVVKIDVALCLWAAATILKLIM